MNNLQKGLVGHWKLNGNAKDSSPYSNHGTIVGATNATDRFGRENGCLEFNGVNDWIVIGDSENLKINGDITITAWIKLLVVDVPNTIIQKHYSYEFDFAVMMYSSQNQARFLWWHGDSGWEDPHSKYVEFSLNTWFFVTAVRTVSNKTMTFYKNGEYFDDRVYNKNIILKSSHPVWIGARGVTSNRMNGSIDDVRIYNRALSVTEIKRLYESYTPL